LDFDFMGVAERAWDLAVALHGSEPTGWNTALTTYSESAPAPLRESEIAAVPWLMAKFGCALALQKR